VGDGVGVPILEIGVVSLFLPSGHTLILKDAVYVPSMRRNLISISTLDKCGYTFNFGNGKLVVSFKSTRVCSRILCDGLYMLNMDEFSVNTVTGSKRSMKDKKFINVMAETFRAYF